VLIASWFFLLVAIAANAAAHVFTIREARRQISLLNEWRSAGCVNASMFEVNVNSDVELNRTARIGREINRTILVALVLGLGCLVFFGAANLLAQNTLREYIEAHPATATTTAQDFKG
jgi:hypothetical protein